MDQAIELEKVTDLARKLRAHAVRMIHAAKASHLGGCLSMAEILACLYGSRLKCDPRKPKSPNRDYFFLSKGHAAAIYYAALAERGFFPVELLENYCVSGGVLPGHATAGKLPGIELSTGSLGHALSVACGVAFHHRQRRMDNRIFVVLSDGELNEGSNWEAVLFAAHHKLDNICVFVDFNKIQSYGTVTQVLNLEPLTEKFRSFGWRVAEVDGHSPAEILGFLDSCETGGMEPSVCIAHTTKGKGIGFAENKLLWHYRNPSDEQLEEALVELGCEGVKAK